MVDGRQKAQVGGRGPVGVRHHNESCSQYFRQSAPRRRKPDRDGVRDNAGSGIGLSEGLACVHRAHLLPACAGHLDAKSNMSAPVSRSDQLVH